MGDILITIGAVLALIVFILVMLGGVMFIGSLFGGVVDLLTSPAQRRDELRQALDGAEIRVTLEHADEIVSFDPSDYKDYLRWRRAQRQKTYRELDEELNAAVKQGSRRPLSHLKRSETRIARRRD